MESERLILRKYTRDDANDLFSWASNENVGPRAGWAPHKKIEESIFIIDEIYNGKTEDAYAIVFKENNRVIGTISLFKDNNRNTNSKELGYVLSEEYWGRGIMAEASALMLDYGFNILSLDHISVRHFNFNDQSKRVIEKLGFENTGFIKHAHKSLIDGKVYDSIIYSLTKEDYEKKYK